MKTTITIPFTKRQIKAIEDRINTTLNIYLKKNPDVIITDDERSTLIRKAKDQLTVYIQEKTENSQHWTLNHKQISLLVTTDSKVKHDDLMSIQDDPQEFLFKKDKDSIVMIDKELVEKSEQKQYMTKSELTKAFYKDLYESASTAAFYSIESLENYKKVCFQ